MNNIDDAQSLNVFDSIIVSVTNFLKGTLFFDIGYGVPFLVAFAMAIFVFCNFAFGFIAFRMFGHSIKVIKGKYNKPDDPGYVTHSQAISTAALSTVGLGSVGGVAVSITVGGPGSIFWIIIAGLLGMSVKFAEIVLGHKYRKFSPDGTISGGPFYYMVDAIKESGLPISIGKVLGIVYALVMYLSALGSANAFQANQISAVFSDAFHMSTGAVLCLVLLVTTCVAIVTFGDVKKISVIAGFIVPPMTIFYLVCTVIIIALHISNFSNALSEIMHDAFTLGALKGGALGVVVQGFARAILATEAGGGTSAIAHAAAKTSEPIREGMTAFVELLISLAVCVLTGLIIVISGAHKMTEVSGVLLTKYAFSSIGHSFTVMMAIAVFFLAVTTIMAWSYYSLMAWEYLFKGKFSIVSKILFVSCTFIGGMTKDVEIIVGLCDMIWTMVLIPNMICLVILSPMIRKEIKEYKRKLKEGLFN